MNALRKLFSFNGGVKPATNKAESTRAPIVPLAELPLPAQFVVPLHQSVGGTPLPLVATGEHVLKGQRIGAADGNFSAAVHAPTSGTVVAVEPRLMAHTSGLSMLSVVIEPDGKDEWMECEPLRWKSFGADEVRDWLRDAGVVGLGGAVFPSHVKLNPGRKTPMKTLVINGAECEPFITCDDLLMRERADKVLAGILIMRELLGAPEVLIGIEDNKPEAVAAMQAACQVHGDASIQAIAVPTRYPAGGAKQLIRVLTGIEVPHGQRSTDYGVQCFNVGTAYAIHEAIELGRPLISRIVTVAGNVGAPRNYEVLFGTPMDHLVRQAGWQEDTDAFIMGGPMMGFRMPAFDVPVVKATNCVIAASPRLFAPPPPEMNCIRCGECARACPTDLQPFEMYWHARAKNFGKVQEYNLFDCIECGCCSFVCPSHIPLVDYYRFAKTEIWDRERKKEAADEARVRFEARNERIEREKREKAEKLAARTAASRAAATVSTETATAANEAPPASPATDDAKKALIEAALARAKAKKEAASSGEAAPATDKPAKKELSAEEKQALVDAALARAKAKKDAAAETSTPAAADDKQALIEAAIARAKEKKAAQTAGTEMSADKPAKKELSAEEKQALVDAALAKAKAKKEAAAVADPASATDTQAVIDAAIARAKEKKAALAAGTETPPDKPAKKELSAEEKQALIDAALERAKAKKAAQAADKEQS
ncbi:electron transport complex subunit RsxC [Uliginosibacterium sp. TH139]|uniref:electron transport complex subunit RsxC n=1 Tax=Uliginosibacterium sp. TH139 TaxID=2067453 RepID=UPI000C796421|nr:electron transport complex subunit RsxC [Uliginosibacterium sp. TH139]PLK48771.1 electron transport complex subunit RsxC [Uliginosibacterium sp. TH139]